MNYVVYSYLTHSLISCFIFIFVPDYCNLVFTLTNSMFFFYILMNLCKFEIACHLKMQTAVTTIVFPQFLSTVIPVVSICDEVSCFV